MTARRIAAVAAAIAAAMCAWLAVLHLRMIVSPAPQEMREGAIVWLTRLLLEGRNPYALSELPASTNAYGIVYHLVVWPFARLFGNGYTVHRAISGLAIAGSCATLFALLRRLNTDGVLAAAGVMLFYASSLYFVAPLARPDSLGVFLSMTSIWWLFDRDVTPSRFAIGLVFALLALLTKIYLAFPPFLVSLYVVLFVSTRRGLAYAAVSMAAAVGVLWLVTLWLPAYINVSVIDNANSSLYYDVDHMKRQTLDWLIYSLPLTVGLVLLFIRAVINGAGLVSVRTAPSLFAFAATVNAVVFLTIFAGHPGAHMTYLFHLVTPLLLLAMLPQLEVDSWTRGLVIVALPIAFVLNAHYFPLTFGRFRAAEATFAALSADIESHRSVLGSTEIAGPLALAGRPVFDSGHSQYFGNAAIDRRWPGLVPADVMRERWRDFLETINNGIAQQRFDLIVRSRRPGLIPADLVAAHYRQAETVEVDFPWGAQRWPLDLWVPRR